VQPGVVSDFANEYSQIVFNFIKNNEERNLGVFLEEEKDSIDLINMKDAKQFTVLSFAAYKNAEDIFVLLFNHALHNNNMRISFTEKQQKFKEWVDSQTDEGFTALHFATYHGNFTLIKFLIETCNADIKKKNKFGSTVMHVAA